MVGRWDRRQGSCGTAVGAAMASIDWVAQKGVAFDHGKPEAVILRRKKAIPRQAHTVPFNKEATRWLGVWLGSQLTLKDHHAIRLKDGKKKMARSRRLAGQMVLSLPNCRRVMTAYIQ